MSSIDKTRSITTSELTPFPPSESDYASRNTLSFSEPAPSYHSHMPGPSGTLDTSDYDAPSPFPQTLPSRPERTTWSQRVKPNARSCFTLHYKTFSCRHVHSHRTRGRRVMMCFLLAWRMAAFAFMILFYDYFISSYGGNGGLAAAVICPVVVFFGIFVSAWSFSLMEKAVEDRRMKGSGSGGGKFVDWYIHCSAIIELFVLVFTFFFSDAYNLAKFGFYLFFVLLDVTVALLMSKPPAVNTMV